MESPLILKFFLENLRNKPIFKSKRYHPANRTAHAEATRPY